ncbi:MAG: spore cortex-lytic enzyme [Paenibacillaceae bacterium]|nr:spore cortex-lytic enzyme [Paenibacillaceae bacterium]
MSKLRWMCIAILLVSCVAGHDAHAFSKATLRVRSRGADVRELQGRLSFLGYYKGKKDGVFGWGTYASVRTFQWKFGMRVDGVVGAKTKLKLVNASKTWRPNLTAQSVSAPKKIYSHHGFSSRDITMMANAVYGEARGEPYVGQVAIAAVILNRVRDDQFPNTPTGVIFQPGAFTAVSDGQIWLTPNETAKRAVRDALNGWDPSHGCLYYFNPVTATSKWIWTRPQVKKIGKHIFCK